MCYSPEEMRTGPGPRRTRFWSAGVEVQASPTLPAKLLMLTQGFPPLKEGARVSPKFKHALFRLYELGQRHDLDVLCQREGPIAWIENIQVVELQVT